MIRPARGRGPRRLLPGTIDRYVLARAMGPMAAAIGSTMVAFLMERLLRSFDLLAQSSHGLEFLSRLMIDLAPHYLGLILPGGFFIGLFVVINRLNQSSEIDAILASGVSLGRIVAPLVALGVVLMMFSLALYGFVQPYSRYAYHAVLHAAENDGWNGEVRPRALVAPSPNLAFTADNADPAGRVLTGVFIRRVAADGRVDVITAARATLERSRDGREVTLTLVDGRELMTPPAGPSQLLSFEQLTERLPLAPTAKLMRDRGGEESELTLIELFQQATGKASPLLPREALFAEFYSRIARAITLPLLPLLAAAFGLAAKRSGSAPAMAVGGILLFAFLAALILGQGLAATGALPAALAEGAPTVLFAAACVGTFVLSRARPGQNPINELTERIAGAITVLIRSPTTDPSKPAARSGARSATSERVRVGGS